MAVSYRPIWVELAKRELMKTEFQKIAGISGNVLAKMGNNEYISMKNLERICLSMDLTPSEVIEFRADEEKDDAR
ncbi:MAG TPA: helix-turn-helix transcriptional regulator [Erysipelotrichaceae bacterium]|nr:helix-turn-helix transcriptional regulator [Erysipelotrichaceae bacterium]